MLCVTLLLLLSARLASVTEAPSFSERLDKLYEKLERLATPPTQAPPQDLIAKLNQLNLLTSGLNDDNDYELLSAVRMWGMLSDDQLAKVARKLRSDESQEKERWDKEEYADGEWNEEYQDPELGEDYVSDWDAEEPEGTSSPGVPEVIPSAFTKQDDQPFKSGQSAVDPIAATTERPRILEGYQLTPNQRQLIRKEAMKNMRTLKHMGQCRTPQPRWLSVRHLAPAADTVYLPQAVRLHRCSHDTGCCYNDAEACGPAKGEYVSMSFLLNKATGSLIPARMVFFNHTECACVPIESLKEDKLEHQDKLSGDSQEVRQTTSQETSSNSEENQSETAEHQAATSPEPVQTSSEPPARTSSEPPAPTSAKTTNATPGTKETITSSEVKETGRKDVEVTSQTNLVTNRFEKLYSQKPVKMDWRPTEEPTEKEEDSTGAPQLRRCTCPALFLARVTESSCACVCDWPELGRRIGCLSLARGQEHFGLRDRVCVDDGHCTPPTCEYGMYDKRAGLCPVRYRFRRMRYHARRRYHPV